MATVLIETGMFKPICTKLWLNLSKTLHLKL